MPARCCHICIRLPVLIHRSACGVFVRGHEEYGASCSVEQQSDFLVGRNAGRPVTLKGNNNSNQKDKTRSEISSGTTCRPDLGCGVWKHERLRPAGFRSAPARRWRVEWVWELGLRLEVCRLPLAIGLLDSRLDVRKLRYIHEQAKVTRSRA